MTNGFLIKDGILESYTLKETVVIIPPDVQIIGKGAFKGCTSIEEVVLPKTLTSIMEGAFKGCKKLKKINFPPILSHIGAYAFHRCHSLIHVKLPLTMKSLSDCTFLYCDSLQFVSMQGVTHLGKQVFLNDINLEEIELASNLDLSCICDVFTGCNKLSTIRLSCGTVFHMGNAIDMMALSSHTPSLIQAIVVDIIRMMEIDHSTLVKFLINLKNVQVPNGITSIGERCFSDKKGIVSVTLPKTLTYIGNMAFENCINLEKIEFTNENVIISENAFKNCTTLKYIVLSNGLTYQLNGLLDTLNQTIPLIVYTIYSQLLNNFFISGTALIQYRGTEERVVVPDGITVIDERAFSHNEAIVEVILPNSIRKIQEEAFSDCLLLQTINFPKELEYIGKSAFENCIKLIRVQLPDLLTVIEKSVFNRCKKLNTVQFGKHIKEIGDFAFYACHSLNDICFPETLNYIGTMAFYQCFSLKEIILPKSLCKLGNNIFTASGIKSATIQCDLKECGTDIFSQCNKLRKLTFEEGVKHISDKLAFQCTSLKYVNLPSSIEYIGKNAFENSIFVKEIAETTRIGNLMIDGSKLSGDIIIPEGVTTIAGGAFYGNTQVTSVIMPETLMRIGSRAFCGCTSLEKITLPSGITVLEEGVFAYCTSLKIIASRGNLTYLSDNVFYCCKELLQIPPFNVTYIGKNAFDGCKKLDNIKITCAHIQGDAFRNTIFLEKLRNHSPLVIISNTIVDGKYCSENIVIPDGVLSISPFAFAGNNHITSITLPTSLISIGESAFYGCKSLKQVRFQSFIKYIGKRAFEKCISLTKAFGNIQEIKDGAYSYCINLKQVIFEQTISFGKEVFYGCTALKICQCKNLNYIGDSCFSGCNSLSEFDFSNVKLIGAHAFEGCNCLKNISLTASISIKEHAFEDCGKLENITLSDENLKYETYAFTGCTALKIISISKKTYITSKYSVIFDKQMPNNIKSIYNSVLTCFCINEKFSLVEYRNKGRFIKIPEGIKRIEREVFKDAINLEEIDIPKSVEYIGARAFHNTMWLEKQSNISSIVIVNNIVIDASKCKGDAVIPHYVKMVSGWAFANCFAITTITFASSKTTVQEYAFRNCIYLKKVIMADGKEYKLTNISDRKKTLPPIVKQIFIDCLNCFKTDETNVLVECTGNIENLVLIDGIIAIGDNVFKDSNLLTYITLTKDIIIIGKSAFEQCKWLLCVKNAFHVKRIEKLAFLGCCLLEYIELSDKLEFIGMRAFENCTSLKSIIIPEGITEIPERAFYRCKSLTIVSLPSTLKTIGKEAFAFCYKLTEIQFPVGLALIDTRAFAWCSNLRSPYPLEGVLVKADSFSGGSYEI